MSSTEPRHSKAELSREIDVAWTALTAVLDRLTPEQATALRDAQGWSVKDHLVHMAAWERSVVVFLQGRPRHEGLGVDEHIVRMDEDRINAAIQEQHRAVPLADALANFHAVHAALLRQIEPLSDDDLYRPNSMFYSEPGEDRDERPVIGLIYSNTAGHFREHLAWIESLVTTSS